MKKLLLVVGALVMTLSGVAMVSAYEAHVVNVRAHVENAMLLSDVGIGPNYGMNFGTVFPEEWSTWDFKIHMSQSFCSYTNQWSIHYEVWVLPKPDGTGGDYPWLGDCLYLGKNVTDKYPVGAVVGNGELTHVGFVYPPASAILTGVISKNGTVGKLVDVITVGIDVPVFEDYYNADTDPEPKPSHLNDPTVIILKTDPRYPLADINDGATLWAEIKVQVIGLDRDPAQPYTPYP